MLQKAIPLLPTINLRATIDFYETRLGFTGINRGSYAIVKCGGAEIHFYLVLKPEDFVPSSCIIYCDNVEDQFSILASKDMLCYKGQINNMALGTTAFNLKDNNGNTIRFCKAP